MYVLTIEMSNNSYQLNSFRKDFCYFLYMKWDYKASITPEKEIHRDSCGKAKTMTPANEETQREPTESEVYFRNGNPSINSHRKFL